MDDKQEDRASYERAGKFKNKEAWQKWLRGFVAEARGTALVMGKGHNNVAVACPCRDGLVKAARRSNATRRPVLEVL